MDINKYLKKGNSVYQKQQIQNVDYLRIILRYIW